MHERACNGCTLCCTLLSVEELNKAPGVTCPHCQVGCGCTIHDARPTECRGFYCDYLLNPALNEDWRPARCRIVVSFEDYNNALVIHVDPNCPDAWRAEPFLSQIEQWSAMPIGTSPRVIVWQGDTKIEVDARINVAGSRGRST